MSWIRNLFLSGATKSEGTLDHIQTKFTHFLLVIEKNNQVLKVISDMEEKLQGEFLFDIAYVRSCLRELRSGALELIEEMIALGGKEYESLLDCFTNIDNRIGILLPGCRPLTADELTVPFDALVRERACSVGSKNAQLGEMRNRVNLPVPDGFAISAWAYKSILDANDLQARISDKLLELDIKEYHQLVQVSGEIRELVKSVCIPGDVKEAIESATAKLVERSGARRFSLRSSAIGEDTLHSFAGQYATFLNVPSELVVERYCDVLASKFTPQAIYYYLSHALSESELAMSVGCVVMIDACASGVVYTRDPLRPGEDVMLIHAVFGLGKYLVDGTLTPDVYRVSRSDGKLIQSEIAVKLRKLMLNPDGGTVEKSVDDEDQARPVLSEKELSDLADFGRRLEDHYGCPQDIEFAVDGEGRVCLLQTRPLRVMDVSRLPPEPDVSGLTPLMDGGETVCPGAGGGPIHHVSSPSDLATIPDGAVVAAAQSFPGIITVMNRASAIVTETGGTANHMATIAREYHIPTLSGVSPISRLPQGEQVTVDATSGMIYAGYQEKLIEARRPEYELFADLAIFGLLRDVLKEISPLNLIHPTDDNFAIDNCRTFHDITRFCHQRAMDEMFHGGLNVEDKDSISVRLKSDIPLQVNIIYVDRELPERGGRTMIEEDDIASQPMRHFWAGVKHEGWPTATPRANVKGFMSVLGTSMVQGERDDFSETSFAILAEDYMILSLRMGYHFTTVEALCTPESGKNYVRMQFKEGGASMERRARRIQLIMDILSRQGYEHHSKGDFLDSRLAYQTREVLYNRLFDLGRLTMLTKQLDMALSNEAIKDWYARDIMKKLGMDPDMGV